MLFGGARSGERAGERRRARRATGGPSSPCRRTASATPCSASSSTAATIAKLDPKLRELGQLRAGWARVDRGFVFSQHCKAARAVGLDESTKSPPFPTGRPPTCSPRSRRAVLAYTDCLVLDGGRTPDGVFAAAEGQPQRRGDPRAHLRHDAVRDARDDLPCAAPRVRRRSTSASPRSPAPGGAGRRRDAHGRFLIPRGDAMAYHHLALAGARPWAAVHHFYEEVMGFELVKVEVAPVQGRRMGRSTSSIAWTATTRGSSPSGSCTTCRAPRISRRTSAAPRGLPEYINHIAFAVSTADDLARREGPLARGRSWTSWRSTTAGAPRSTRRIRTTTLVEFCLTTGTFNRRRPRCGGRRRSPPQRRHSASRHRGSRSIALEAPGEAPPYPPYPEESHESCRLRRRSEVARARGAENRTHPDHATWSSRSAPAAVCHSDLSIMRGYVPVPPGMVLGHEGAGRVRRGRRRGVAP